MKQTIDISLDVSKIDKTALYESPKRWVHRPKDQQGT
jgi:hypothetical protein